jgi:hypothetical protein
MLTESATATGMNSTLFMVRLNHGNCELKQTLLYQHGKILGSVMRRFEG